MMTLSLENWSYFTDLEKSFYEKLSYENLLSYMSNRNIPTNEYFEEYQNVIKTYSELCQKLEQEIIIPATNQEKVFWEVDFVDKCVKIRKESN